MLLSVKAFQTYLFFFFFLYLFSYLQNVLGFFPKHYTASFLCLSVCGCGRCCLIPHTHLIFTHSADHPPSSWLKKGLFLQWLVSMATAIPSSSHKCLSSILHPLIPDSSLPSHPIYTPPRPIISLSYTRTHSSCLSSILKREKRREIKGDNSRHECTFLDPWK